MTLEDLIDEAHAKGCLISGLGEWPDINSRNVRATDGWWVRLVKPDNSVTGDIRGATPAEALRAAIDAATAAPAVEEEDIFG